MDNWELFNLLLEAELNFVFFDVEGVFETFGDSFGFFLPVDSSALSSLLFFALFFCFLDGGVLVAAVLLSWDELTFFAELDLVFFCMVLIVDFMQVVNKTINKIKLLTIERSSWKLACSERDFFFFLIGVIGLAGLFLSDSTESLRFSISSS